ncbi:MAG TPA: hypothetical protein VJ810_21750 [Blastocatellia bacterium]|nr:hypothetical protein [Blastocatellia bacterium]
MNNAQQRPGKRSRLKMIMLAVLALALAWLGYDLYGPRSSKLRDFDPHEIARLETGMWRSYYAKDRVKLFTQLTELLRSQYNMPFARSNAVAYQAARAAFVFKDGKKRADYEKALPHLVKVYQAVRDGSDTPFDAEKAAKLELEWWIIHRQRARHEPGDLDRALAELPAEIYQEPVEKMMEHARLRAEAMTIRDKKAEASRVTEDDWKKIEELLRASWQSLWKAVNS